MNRLWILILAALLFSGCRQPTGNFGQQSLFGGNTALPGFQPGGSLFGGTGIPNINGVNGSFNGGGGGSLFGNASNVFAPDNGRLAAQQAVERATQQSGQLVGQVQNLNSQLGQFDSDNQNLHAQVAALQQRLQNSNNYNDQLRQQLNDQVNQLQQAQVQVQQVNTQAQQQIATARAAAVQAQNQSQIQNARLNNGTSNQVVGQLASTGGNGSGFNGATIRANNGLLQRLQTVQLNGFKTWMDGDVIRIEGPTDRLFVSGTYQINNNDSATLTSLANTIRQNFPRQRIGIEAHWDGSPIQPPTISHHQLTSNQTLAMFDLLAKAGLPNDQIFLMAMGSIRPRYAINNPANRRIEIVIYPETY